MARLTREESREQTRERLLEAGRTAVARAGYDGVSIAAIAEQAGFSKGAFFSNFASKEALLLELLARHKARDIAAAEAILESVRLGDDPAAALGGQLATLGNDADWIRLDIELQLHAARNPAFAADYDALQARNREAFGRLAGLLFAKAGKRPPFETGRFADLLTGLVHGLVLQGTGDPGALVRFVISNALAAAPPA